MAFAATEYATRNRDHGFKQALIECGHPASIRRKNITSADDADRCM
jgi:hypothetical protein